jgi:hypothetical protein
MGEPNFPDMEDRKSRATGERSGILRIPIKKEE